MSTTRNIHDVFTYIYSGLGISVSLEDVNNIVNLILLIIGIVNLLVTLIFRILHTIKTKDFSEETIHDILNDTEDTINSIKEKVNGGDKD